MSILVRKAEVLARQQNLKSAYELLCEADTRGSSEASYALGTWYLFGKYVKKDLNKAVEYLNKSAKKGNADALFNLAVCYEKGAGINKNLRKAFEFYCQAFDHGDFNAAYEVGRMLYYGLGVAKNLDLAELFITLSKQKKLPIRKSSSKVFSKPAKSSSYQLA